MFDFLKNKRPKNDRPPRVAPASAAPSSTQQHNNVRRELIRVVLKDTLRLHGIPFGWLACEIIIIARAPDDEELHIQLVIMKWNEQLLRYAPALHQELLLGLDRFDPSIDHSKYIVSWRFSPDCGYPVTRMPDPNYWRKAVIHQADAEPIPILDRRHTKRSRNAPKLNPSPSDAHNPSPNFAPTQTAPLR
jgi:hypothetical protein